MKLMYYHPYFNASRIQKSSCLWALKCFQRSRSNNHVIGYELKDTGLRYAHQCRNPAIQHNASDLVASFFRSAIPRA